MSNGTIGSLADVYIVVHDPDFRVSFQDFTTFAEKVSEKIIEADETIPELPVKDVVSVSDWTVAVRFTKKCRSTGFTEVSPKYGLSWIMLTVERYSVLERPNPVQGEWIHRTSTLGWGHALEAVSRSRETQHAAKSSWHYGIYSATRRIASA